MIPSKLCASTLLVACIALTACGGSSGVEISKRNPNFFLAKTNDGVVSGQYNPAGFSSSKVQVLLANLCASRAIASYGEKAMDGLVAFSATCDGQTTFPRGSTEFERMSSGSTMLESTYSDGSGNLAFDQRVVSVL